MKAAKRMALIVVAAGVALYVVLCGAVFAFQRSLLYFPQGMSRTADGTTMISLPVGAETVQVSLRASAGPDAVLYFGGNAEDVAQSLPDFAAEFPGTAIYLLHYPGYGGSSGSPSQKSIFAAGLALYDRVHAEHPNILVIGRSLGSGVAVWIASQRPVVRVVLVTPYDSLADAAARQYPFLPVRWMLVDKFESWRYAPQVTAPTRLIVAADDEIIPRSSSDRLRTRFRGDNVSYVVLPDVGHNTIQESPDYWRLLNSE
ncbi:MAG TPA: alpha/beta hydrolase [Acidobacteriaceae bacterium]|jgi:hypothetical protein